MIKTSAENLMARAKRAYKKGNHKEALSNLLRLDDLKMDLIWKFEAGKAISCLCIAKHARAWEEQTQIIVGSEDNMVYSISMENELLWKFEAEDEITSVMALDLTKDFSHEIIVGSKDCNIYVLNSTGELLWKYKIDKPIQCITGTRKDGKSIFVVGTFGGAIYFLEYKENIFWEYFHKNSREITGLCLANLVQDGDDELIAVTDNGDIIILDYKKRLLKREMHLNTSLYGVLAKDIDNNGANEILVCSENAQVYCLDAYGHMKWQYQTKDSVYSIHCCDIDNDNDMEVILGTRDNYVYVIDSQGNFKWRYQTDHNVWSVFTAPITHEKFYDLFAGLSNRNLYHYKLIDNKNTRAKIDKSYLSLLSSGRDEFELLAEFSKDTDEYFRKFAIETMAKFVNENQLRPKILECIERLLEDNSPLVRSAAIKTIIKLTDYEPEMIILKLLNKLRCEDNEEVRNSLIECIAQDYSRTIKQNRKIELLECLHILNKHWKEKDFALNHNMFERSKEKFETGNFKDALRDFELLKERGLDLLWKTKTKGFVCSVAAEDIDGDGFNEIAITSSKHMLYLFDHTGQQRWVNEIGGFRNSVKIDDIDGDGSFEIILGCSDGTFTIYDPDGKKKNSVSINHKMNCFSLLKNVNGPWKDIVCGCTNGYIHCLDLTNKEIWRFRIGSRILRIEVGDIDGDKHEEVIIGTLHGHLYVLDSKGKTKWVWKGDDDIESIVAVDFEEEKKPSLIVGTRNGRIYALDSKGKERLIKQLNANLSDIAINDINSDGQREMIVADQSNYISLIDKTGNKKSYTICISSGTVTCLACCDIEKDGYQELIIGAEDDYIYLYRILKLDEIDKYIEDSKERISKIENKVSFFRKEVFRFIKDNLEMNYATPKKILLLGYLGTGKSDLL
ncbi:MAG: HEAT repeat domain-containing protein [bacterium]